ncbi:hypothetical protein Y032_0121g988 [Ancylostoma ceylanicum]|uniref:Uncharacterized protein n=1 Tax=Ancylostoma ceylanicum TaxID=53326 RepID=A0A016TAL4_9BILA|nr:hypothetical protein Y032_0121g988 [Ancylostoma ceylanicum]
MVVFVTLSICSRAGFYLNVRRWGLSYYVKEDMSLLKILAKCLANTLIRPRLRLEMYAQVILAHPVDGYE